MEDQNFGYLPMDDLDDIGDEEMLDFSGLDELPLMDMGFGFDESQYNAVVATAQGSNVVAPLSTTPTIRAAAPTVMNAPQGSTVVTPLPTIPTIRPAAPTVMNTPQGSTVVTPLPTTPIIRPAAPTIVNAPQGSTVVTPLPTTPTIRPAAPTVMNAPQGSTVFTPLPTTPTIRAAAPTVMNAPQGSTVVTPLPTAPTMRAAAPTVMNAPQGSTLLYSAPQAMTSVPFQTVVAPRGPTMLLQASQTPTSILQPTSQATPRMTNNLVASKPLFFIAPSNPVQNIVSLTSSPARMASVAIRPKLQKIAPSPSKELNKIPIQVAVQPVNSSTNKQNVQLMVLGSNSTIQPASSAIVTNASTTTKVLTTPNIQALPKTAIQPLKPSRPTSMNFLQLVAPNKNSNQMLVQLSPSGNKFGTVVQPVSKPGMPPSSATPTRVLMYNRPRAPTPTTINVSTPTGGPRIINSVSAAKDPSFRTISGTDANISSSKLFGSTVPAARPGPQNATPFRVVTPGDDNRRKACNCNKSQCLKLYCECFANGEFCQNCNCVNCCNNLDHEEMRQKAIRFCLDRNPAAFHPKIGQKSSDVTHKKGCNCKKSNCLKNYCECYEAKILCTDKCKCCGCKNFEPVAERRAAMLGVGMTVSQHMAAKQHEKDQENQEALPVWEPNADMKLPFKVSADMNPFNLLTDETLDATACCLIAQREEAENEGQDGDSIQRLTLEMFGDCINQMFNLDGSKKFKKADGEVKFLQAKK